jgi:2-polyprenyl-3-methyl-5-hydroxy-6-metoxy-1,4-benzoquinol methylase
MPDADLFSRGYSLYYQHQQSRYTRRRTLRSFQRDFRRGTHFARAHLTHLRHPGNPLSILEIGAGSGYFSQGIGRVFPDTTVTYIDIVPDLCAYYTGHFECTAVAGEFQANLFPENRFDLVIARDLLEHVRNPRTFMEDVGAVLKPDGLFHFITPNGRENLWLINQALLHEEREAVILINHVHYFLPQVLDRLLSVAGLQKLVGYKWDLKGHKKGIGHKTMRTVPNLDLPDMDTDRSTCPVSRLWEHHLEEVTSSLLHGGGPLSRLYSSIRDSPRGRCGYDAPQGRQFFVIAGKADG